MIASIFGYSIVIALLGGLAAASAELVLAEFRLPRRFAWLGAFAVALAFPPLAWLLAPAVPAGLAVASPEPLQQLFAPYSAIDWNTPLVALWIAATTSLLVLYAAAWLRLSRLAQLWPQETSDAAPVVVADDVGPAVLGILRPRIVLPRWLMDAPAAARGTVLAHELEHIAARDHACIVAAQLVTMLLPWNLPLWWFVRRLRAAIELDCDARVLRRGVNAADYAHVLLTVAQRGTKPPLMGTALIEPITQLERRIRIMLERSNSASKKRVVPAVALALGIAACTTQLQPPPLPSGSAPTAEPESARTTAESNDVEISAQSIEISAPSASSDGIAASAGDVVAMRNVLLSLKDMGNVTAQADRIVQTAQGMRLEGNVRLSIDNVSIKTSRAVFRTTPDGKALVEMDDAAITNSD